MHANILSIFETTLPTDCIENQIVSSQITLKILLHMMAGYISHSLIQRSKCDACFELLQKDRMNNSYIEILNRGGLQLPTVVLYQYVETAFCIPYFLE